MLHLLQKQSKFSYEGLAFRMLLILWNSSSVTPVHACAFVCNDWPIRHRRLTLLCVVLHFDLQVTRVRLHCQDATLQVLLLAIVGVFEGDVSLERGTKKERKKKSWV